MTGPENDEDFERYLQQRTVLPHRLAKTDRLEPPPELDRIVLARAREAIHSSEPGKVYRSARWALPFGLAATVVIASAVLLHMREQPVSKAVRAVPVQTMTAARELAPSSPAASASERQRSPVTHAYARAQEPKNGLPDQAARSAPRAQEPHVQRLEMAKGDDLQIPSPAAEANRAPLMAQAPMSAPAPMSAIGVGSPEQKAALLTPADWRAKISRLRTEGKTAEADREQAAFHKAYPAEKTAGDR